MTNALKAQIIVAVNAILACIMTFGDWLTTAQSGSIAIAANAVLGIWVAMTYKNSPRRTPDA